MLSEQPRICMGTIFGWSVFGTRTRTWSEMGAWHVVTAVSCDCADRPGLRTIVRTVPGLSEAGLPSGLPW